jgi:D-lactate dehydrogenase
MPGAKIVFFDVKDYEKNFLNENKPENCEFILIKENFSEGFESNYQDIKDVEILSVFTSSKVSEELLRRMPDLKIIATRSTGYNNVDLEYCKQAGISVVNVPGYGEVTVAEFTFALLLNVIRNVSKAYEQLKKGKINLQGSIGMDLLGKTIGIIGTGSIGCYTAKIAYGFGMKILSYDPFPKEELKDQFKVDYVSFEDLLSKSDIISLHAPSTKQNFHMINDAAFSRMKDGVIIINTARGEIMDTNALYKALKSGKVAGAGLDVLECEDIIANEELFLAKIDCVHKECLEKTLINHKLLDMPNVIVTPHIAFDTIEAVHRILQTTINNIKAYLEGNIINRVL